MFNLEGMGGGKREGEEERERERKEACSQGVLIGAMHPPGIRKISKTNTSISRTHVASV
jgi:hypothetical protein